MFGLLISLPVSEVSMSEALFSCVLEYMLLQADEAKAV